MKTRGWRTLLCAKLQKQICGYLSDRTTVKTACEASGISLSSFFLSIEKGEKGQSPYKEFSDAVTRARGKAKVKLSVHSWTKKIGDRDGIAGTSFPR
jgi:hypothetical protein